LTRARNAPRAVVRIHDLSVTEWPCRRATASWDLFFWAKRGRSSTQLLELASSAIKPIVFLDDPPDLSKPLGIPRHANGNYERHGHTNSPTSHHFFWRDENLHTASPVLANQMEELALSRPLKIVFAFFTPSSRFTADVVACVGAIKSQLAAGGTCIFPPQAR